MKSKRTQVAQLNNELSNIPSNTPLQIWLDLASKINDTVSNALEGIYCGKEGRIHEQLDGTNIWLTMGWYTVDTTPKVEYAYFS